MHKYIKSCTKALTWKVTATNEELLTTETNSVLESIGCVSCAVPSIRVAPSDDADGDCVCVLVWDPVRVIVGVCVDSCEVVEVELGVDACDIDCVCERDCVCEVVCVIDAVRNCDTVCVGVWLGEEVELAVGCCDEVLVWDRLCVAVDVTVGDGVNVVVGVPDRVTDWLSVWLELAVGV